MAEELTPEEKEWAENKTEPKIFHAKAPLKIEHVIIAALLVVILILATTTNQCPVNIPAQNITTNISVQETNSIFKNGTQAGYMVGKASVLCDAGLLKNSTININGKTYLMCDYVRVIEKEIGVR